MVATVLFAPTRPLRIASTWHITSPIVMVVILKKMHLGNTWGNLSRVGTGGLTKMVPTRRQTSRRMIRREELRNGRTRHLFTGSGQARYFQTLQCPGHRT